jgi:LEA14-like dessication related protein
MPALPLLVVLGAGYLLIRSQSEVAGQVQWRITKVIVNRKSFSLTGIAVITRFEIVNPANGTTRINSIAGNLYSGKQLLGQFNYLTPFDLTPRGKQTIDVVTNIDSIEAAKLLVTSILKLTIPSFTIQGKINTPVAAVPFDYTTKPTTTT